VGFSLENKNENIGELAARLIAEIRADRQENEKTPLPSEPQSQAENTPG
jgi:hypothetical protein